MNNIRSIKYIINDTIYEIIDLIKRLKPFSTPKAYQNYLKNKKRWKNGIKILEKLSCSEYLGPHKEVDINGSILIDGIWENANYWLRYTLLRKGLSLYNHEEIGLIGMYNTKKVSEIFKSFNIKKTVSLKISKDQHNACVNKAKYLSTKFREAEDILKYKWPNNIPSAIIYDEILREQKGAKVDVHHPRFPEHVYKPLAAIEIAKNIFNNNNFGLVVLSHIFPHYHSAIIWTAIKKNVPVIIMSGAFGSLRLTKIEDENDYKLISNAPSPDEIMSLTNQQRDSLYKAGLSYMKKRFLGRGDDVGSKFAYIDRKKSINRDELCQLFDWPSQRPIVVIYASKWFDTPHAYGMTNFRDFLDWIETTIEVAKEVKDVSWLLKAHPCDKWYGGTTLRDVVKEFDDENIKFADDDWNGASVIKSVDNLITVHGTAGLEYSCMNKPVLCADRGWYSDSGFVKVATSKSNYIDLLHTKWWLDIDSKSSYRNAVTFTGFFYSVPSIQDNFVFPDDIIQDELYDLLDVLINKKVASVKYDVKKIYEWYKSGKKTYHPYKMKYSEKYTEIIN
tara:strand:+ start:1255 stop:2937 length:1683 start_codon:yes stop_codon:yes gene_type:complete